ncbi:MAG TPA: glycoside hydrolase family 2 TIM barrel-domain containing protein [Gemmatimonas sp.]|nr:glycoside hydrolase family 2 TIM barrel-domain containing protein [Gemmatimonas sp.]
MDSSSIPSPTSDLRSPIPPTDSIEANPVEGSRGYPRPELEREGWESLDGPWEFAIDVDAIWSVPSQVKFTGTIQVPFAPETAMSGIGYTGFFRSCWYRRKVTVPTLVDGERILLHFGAVDYAAVVWVNGHPAGFHEGGYTPFTIDMTYFVRAGERATIVLRAEDDPHDLAKPRGKQDWQLEPHSIWYPRTTGIWQTVWLEKVPATWIDSVRWTSNLERYEIGIEAWCQGLRREGLRLNVKLSVGDRVLADDTYTVIAGEVHRRIALSDPGIDDFRNEILWSPERPQLIKAELFLWGGRGELIDAVRSYTAIRNVSTQMGRFMLNGRPYYLRMVLDQGYWPESGITAPSDDALKRDVELAKAMGFNGVRKHQKIEDPRFLFWADTLGLMVWEEMPSAYRFTKQSVDRLTREWTAVIDRDYSHPCIVTWVPFNESWGVPDLPAIEAQRHYVQALYHLTKTLDPTRPVVGNDGWESAATDIIGIHDYDSDPGRIERRYDTQDVVPQLLKQVGPAGRLITLEGYEHRGQPLMVTECGGIAFASDKQSTWGYSRSESADEFAARYSALIAAFHGLPLLAGFCYTQFTDTYQEANGLLFADRTPKIPIEQLYAATHGRNDPRQQAMGIAGPPTPE